MSEYIYHLSNDGAMSCTVGHRVTMKDKQGEFETLEDILPKSKGNSLVMLIIPKRPLPGSVKAGHYFQGKLTKYGRRVGNGPTFWKQLKEYGILKVPPGTYEDDCLLAQGIGIMDVVKRPGETGDEPSDEEYRVGAGRILRAIETFRPKVLLFPYTKPLRQLVSAYWHVEPELAYGFNRNLEGYFGIKVFLCPLPGVGGATKEAIVDAMMELKQELKEAI